MSKSLEYTLPHFLPIKIENDGFISSDISQIEVEKDISNSSGTCLRTPQPNQLEPLPIIKKENTNDEDANFSYHDNLLSEHSIFFESSTSDLKAEEPEEWNSTVKCEVIENNEANQSLTNNANGVSENCWIRGEIITSGKYFSLINCEGNSVGCRCLMCPPEKKTVIRAGISSVYNLKKHVKRRHSEFEDEFEECRKRRRAQRYNIQKETSPRLLTLENKAGVAINQETFNNRIVDFIIDAMLPLSIIENDKFKELFKDITPGLSMPSRHSLGCGLVELTSSVKEKITNRLSQQNYVCMTADIWNTKYRSFIGVTVHWLDELTMERCSATLSCKRFSGRSTYDCITKILVDIMRDYSIPESKIVAITTKNGSDFHQAFKEFGIELKFHTGKDDCTDQHIESNNDDVVATIGITAADSSDSDLLPLPFPKTCTDHMLRLASSSDATKALNGQLANIHQSSMDKCSVLWNESGKPKSAEIIQNILNCSLQLPCPTRWNSLYDSLLFMLSKKANLNRLMVALDLQPFIEAELEYLEEYIDAVKPLMLALDRLQGDRNSYYGCLLPTLFAVQKKLARRGSSYQQNTHSLVEALMNGFNNRFKKFLKLDADANDAILATITHPQFKIKWLTITKGTNTEIVRKKVQNLFLSELKKLKECEQSESTDMPTSTEDDNLCCSNDDFYEFDLEAGNQKSDDTAAAEMEVLKFLNDERTSLSMLSDHISIKKLFLRFNTPLLSSAPVERLFSYTEHIHAARRGNLTDRNFEQRVLLKGNSNFL